MEPSSGTFIPETKSNGSCKGDSNSKRFEIQYESITKVKTETGTQVSPDKKINAHTLRTQNNEAIKVLSMLT